MADDPFVLEGPVSKEYYYLQDLIGKFNENCFETKKWSVALTSAAAIFAGFSGKSALFSAILIFFLALAFWVTETVWRANAEAFIRRVRELESLGSGTSPRISRSWARFTFGPIALAETGEQSLDNSWETDPPEDKFKRLKKHFLDKRTALPHAVIVALAFAGVAASLGQTLAPPPEPGAKTLSSYEVSLKSDGTVSVKEIAKK